MIKRTPYHILNINKNSPATNLDEEIFRKFIGMIGTIEEQKIIKIDYRTTQNKNLNYEQREAEYIKNQETLLKMIELQKSTIEAYKKIATKAKREEYEKEKTQNESFKEKYKIENKQDSENRKIDAYNILGIAEKDDKIKRKEDIDKYDDEIKNNYAIKIDQIGDEIYNQIAKIQSIYTDEIHVENTKVINLEKVINQEINKLEKAIKEEEEIIRSYILIANNKRRQKYNIEKNTYEIDLKLASNKIKRENYKSKALRLRPTKKEILELIPISRIWYERGIDNKKASLIEYILKKYTQTQDTEGKEIWEYIGQSTIYTENDLATMIAIAPELEEYIAKYLLSPENIERSKETGNYVGLISVKDKNYHIIKEKTAERVAKMAENMKQNHKKEEKEEIK